MQKWQGKPVIAWSIVLGLWAAMRLSPYLGAERLTPKSLAIGPIRAFGTIAFIPAASAQQAASREAMGKSKTVQSHYGHNVKAPHSNGSPVITLVSTKALGHKIRGLPVPSALQTAHYFARPAASVQANTMIANFASLPQYPIKTNSQKRLSIYAYSFIRPNASVPGALETSAPQYGGGQSGIIAAYHMAGNTRRNVSLLGRASLAHGAQGASEFAAGVRIKPLSDVPVTISAERRFRTGQQDVTALYAAGSVEDIALPAQLMTRGYAQAGILSGRQSNSFYDAGIRIDRVVINTAIGQIYAGIGVWAGGQRGGIQGGGGRLDAGPALRTEVKIAGTARANITADWRFRIAGNAKPGNGPAITISTGF